MQRIKKKVVKIQEKTRKNKIVNTGVGSYVTANLLSPSSKQVLTSSIKRCLVARERRGLPPSSSDDVINLHGGPRPCDILKTYALFLCATQSN